MSDSKVYAIKTEYIDSEFTVELSGYTNDDSLAVMLSYVDEPWEYEHASINLSAYPHLPKPGMGQFYVKDDSEHEGLPVALEVAGIAVRLQSVTYGPFSTKAHLMQLTIDNEIGL